MVDQIFRVSTFSITTAGIDVLTPNIMGSTKIKMGHKIVQNVYTYLALVRLGEDSGEFALEVTVCTGVGGADATVEVDARDVTGGGSTTSSAAGDAG